MNGEEDLIHVEPGSVAQKRTAAFAVGVHFSKRQKSGARAQFNAQPGRLAGEGGDEGIAAPRGPGQIVEEGIAHPGVETHSRFGKEGTVAHGETPRRGPRRTPHADGLVKLPHRLYIVAGNFQFGRRKVQKIVQGGTPPDGADGVEKGMQSGSVLLEVFAHDLFRPLESAPRGEDQVVSGVPQTDAVGDKFGPACVVQSQHMQDLEHDVGVAPRKVEPRVEAHPVTGEAAQKTADLGLTFDHRDLPPRLGKEQCKGEPPCPGADDDRPRLSHQMTRPPLTAIT